MHTPDGFITSWFCVLILIFALSFIIFSVYDIRKRLNWKRVLQMSGLAAVIFAFQMLNFPIANGTSGHLIGAGIAAILFGPSAAILILTAVLLVQAVVYGDGGMLSLGVNILNMGIVASYVTYFSYKPLMKKNKILAGMIASWLGVVAASIVCALELGISGTFSFSAGIPAMAIPHMFIGIGEAIITGGIMAYTLRFSTESSLKSTFKYVVSSVFLAGIVLAFLLPFASTYPDGLEKVAINMGFFERATTLYPFALMPGYTFLGSESYIFVLIAGLTGMALTYFVSMAIAALLIKPTKS